MSVQAGAVMGSHRGLGEALFQGEGKGWTGGRGVVTIPGRRDSFCKSLDREGSEFLESLSVVYTGEGGGKKVRVSDFCWPHLTSKHSFSCLVQIMVNIFECGI